MPRPDSRDAKPDAGRQPAPPDEAALVVRVAAADRAAFETLYRAYYPRLRRFLERMTRRLPLVEEVVNDTMMVVWRRAHTYDRVSKVSTWIFAIAYRQALKALSRVDDAVLPSDSDEIVPAYAQPEGELQREQWRAHLGEALGALSPEHRAVIELTYYNGYACREVAEIMGCPVDTVKTRMFYARRKLKTLLALNAEDAI